MAVNSFVFEGNLGKDPELKTHGEMHFCTFSIAQTTRRKSRGKVIEDTMWVDVTVWGEVSAANHVKNLHKGRKVVVTGRLTLDEWTDRNGNSQKTLKLKANDVEYMDDPTRRGGDDQFSEPDPDETYSAEPPLTADTEKAPW